MTDGAAFVGVDIGGTFTDVALVDPSGELHVGKLPTTPEDPRVAVVDGVRSVLTTASVDPDCVVRVVHGTTLATNVVLERRGGRVALVATAGFGDLLRLGRQARVEDDRYDLRYTPPAPPVDAALTFEVAERVGPTGAVLVGLTDDASQDLARRVADAAPDAVAVCLLHAYANPAHEQQVAAAIRAALPEAFVVASGDVWPEMREYERAMTTVVCALVGPVMASYLEGLEHDLAAIGVRCPVEVMESSGGVLPARAAARRPVCTVESGGAAGVLAAGLVGARVGTPDVISFDMGGTTAKTGIVRGGRPTIAHDFQIGGKGSFGGARPGTGIPVKIPVIDLAEVGAGGGSIAWVDAGGAVRVGPQSAGAVPGPACYSRGGRAPTVTDANLVLGYLEPAGLAGGLRLSTDRAEAAIADVAERVGLELGDAALAIHEIANANMAAAIRMVTVQRGIDPRGFTVVAFGGAGPSHVARLAETFGIRSVIVPWGAGVASAVGLVTSEPTMEVAQTHVADLGEADATGIGERFAELEARARAELGEVGDSTAVTRSADVRFRGQAHELTVSLPDELADRPATIDARFREQYRAEYGIESDAPAQLVSLRVRVVQAVPTPRWPAATVAATTAAEPTGTRAARFPGGREAVATPVFDWGGLAAGAHLRGPGLVVGPDTTVVVPSGFHAALDGARNLRLTALDR